MSKWRRKPVIVDAFQWTGGPNQTEDPIWIINAIKKKKVWFTNSGMHFLIRDLVFTVYPSDWVIRDSKGNLSVCKDKIFKQRYERSI